MTLPPIPAPWYFNATLLTWHDADTGWFEIDRGMYEYARWDIRILGGNARELSMPGGPEALAAIEELVPPGTKATLATVKPDKFGGRLDAQITYTGADGQPHDLTTDLIAAGWMAAWDGKGTKPVPPWPRTVA